MAKKINVKGVIVFDDYKWIYDWFGMGSTSPGDVEKGIEEANGDDIIVYINSGGGYVDAGSEIYTMLKNYSEKVDIEIVGVAASAASVIAMGNANGGKVKITPTGQLMIHNTSSTASGDYRAMEHEAGVLKNYNKAIANAYILKTGMKQEDLLDLMDKETWLNAQQAKEYGFVDEIMFDEGNQLVASAGSFAILPPEVINKIRNTIKGPKEPQNNQIEEFKQKLAYKNKQVASFLFYQKQEKQGGIKHV